MVNSSKPDVGFAAISDMHSQVEVVPPGRPEWSGGLSWIGLHRRAKNQPLARLLIIPFAGGNASAFFPLLTEIGYESHLDVIVLQPPGRGTRHHEPPLESLESYASVVAAVAGHAAEVGGSVPLIILGYSMGGVVAYLTARDHYEELPLVEVIVAARTAPTASDPLSGGRALMSHASVIDRLRKLQGTPEAVLQNPDIMEPVLDSIATEFYLIDNWSTTRIAPLNVDITAVAGLDDPETPPTRVLEWEHLTKGHFNATFVQGGHFFLQTACPDLGRIIRQAVDNQIERSR
ncbi:MULTISPECIES: thioesterase II family protein [Corynebacterium]|uniref:thioesterase II family protein n=1 Tax=Corynebacterium TaxID=1716 RepID=UPI002650C43D|nr:alpha/beta fold hydrolase [Corynebacterium kefirresidentii]MDN8634742.1 alpha/beta fold hydrolase [Corynebacterium kefirresidentii]